MLQDMILMGINEIMALISKEEEAIKSMATRGFGF